MLRADRRSPHCERKFRFIFAPLYWPTTWGQVHLMPLDRPVIDLCWCDSHGVCTRLSALSFFGYDIEQNLFCGLPLESLYHLFFFCPLAQSGISWAVGSHPLSTISCLVFLTPSLSSREVFVYLVNVLMFQIWVIRNHRYRQVAPGAVGLIAATRARVRFSLPLLAKRFVSVIRRRYFERQWGLLS